MKMPAISPGPSSALPRSSSRAAIASGSKCYLPISSASYDLAGSDCAARAAHKMSSRSAPSRRTSAALQSWLLDRRQQQSRALRNRSNAHQRSTGRTNNRSPPQEAAAGAPQLKSPIFATKSLTKQTFIYAKPCLPWGQERKSSVGDMIEIEILRLARGTFSDKRSSRGRMNIRRLEISSPRLVKSKEVVLCLFYLDAQFSVPV